MDKKALEIITRLQTEFGKNYRKLGNGIWKFEIITEDKRSQVVTLIYKKNEFTEKNISRFVVFSPIGPIDRHFNFENVLRMNSELEIATSTITEGSDVYTQSYY